MSTNSQVSRILIIGPAWIGDMIMTQSLLIALKEKYPTAIIDLVVPKATATIAQRIPEINQIFCLEVKHGEFGWKKRKELASQLGSYDLAYVLPTTWKAALVPFFAKVKTRIGWDFISRYPLLNKNLGRLNKTKLPLMLHNYLGLLFSDDPQHQDLLDPNDLRGKKLKKYFPRLTAEPLDPEFAYLEKLKFIVLAPGASKVAKRWPHFYFTSLAEQLLKQTNYTILLLGGADEVEICQEISDKLNNPRVINLTHKLSILKSLDIIAWAQAVVVNDSGLMHISCALNVKTLAIYGPTTPTFAPPLSDNAAIIWPGDQPGYKADFKVKFSSDHPQGYHRSSLSIKPETVLQELYRLIYTPKV